MIDLLTIEDSLADKPSFRWRLESHEKDITDLENILEKISRNCKTFCDTGRVFCDSMGPFTEGITELANHFKEDEDISEALNTFTEHLDLLKSFYDMLLEQARCGILTSMTEVIKKNLKDVKQHRKAFKEKSDELDGALNTNASRVVRKKDTEDTAADTCLADLATTKIEFHHTSVDYVYEVNKFQMEKHFLVTEKFLHLMYSWYSFFHQGYLILQDIDPYLKNLNVLMQQKKNLSDNTITQLDGRHKAVSDLKNNQYDGLMITPKDKTVLLEGYLYKRSHNTFRSWKRRYFFITQNQLHYQKRGKGNRLEENKIVSEDLRLSHVRSTDEQDRRYCFELIMPSKKIYLQADSQKIKDEWIRSLQSGIEAAIHNSTPEEHEPESPNSNRGSYVRKAGNSDEILRLIEDIKTLPGNEICADCDSNEPVWASMNLGVTLCIECSGIHRNLGVHISKVKSLELDTWETEQCLLMVKLGNSKVNQLFEHSINANMSKPKGSLSTTSLAEREVWIKAKYEDRLFIENREYVAVKRRHISAGSLRSKGISYNGALESISANSTIKSRTSVKQYSMRPLSKLFNRKSKRSGSDGAAYIDTDETRCLSPEYALIGSEDSPDDSSNPPDTCVPAHLLSHSISRSNPNLCELTSKEIDDGNDTSEMSTDNNLNLIGPLTLNHNLYQASGEGNILDMYKYIIEGANINFKHSAHNDKTPLISSIHTGSLEAVQLLVLNGADVNLPDNDKRHPIHHATELGFTHLVCVLVKRGARHQVTDCDNKEPLDIAIEKKNSSLVTILRFLRINEVTDAASQQMLSEFSQKYLSSRDDAAS